MVCLGDVDEGPLAVDIGGVFVHVEDHGLGFLLDEGVHAHAGGPVAHVALLVGGGHVQEGDVGMEGVVAPLVHLAQVDGGVVQGPHFQGPAVLVAHEVGAEPEGLGVGAVQQGHGGEDVGQADGDILQFFGALGQLVGDGPGVAGTAADVHVHAALDHGGGLGGGDLFFLKFLFQMFSHGVPPVTGSG